MKQWQIRGSASSGFSGGSSGGGALVYSPTNNLTINNYASSDPASLTGDLQQAFDRLMEACRLKGRAMMWTVRSVAGVQPLPSLQLPLPQSLPQMA